MNQYAKAKESVDASSKSGILLLWTSIGPILLLLAALIGSLHKSAYMPWLGVIAAFSAFTVFFLGAKGMLLSALLFGSALAYQWAIQGFSEGPFTFLLAISFLLGVLVFALGLSEARALFDEVAKESKSRLSALWKLEEKTRNDEKRFEQELAKQQKSPVDSRDHEKDRLLKQAQKELEEERKEKESSLKQIQEMQCRLESLALDKQLKEKSELKAREDDETTLLSLQNELAEANKQLQDHENEEIRLRTIEKEMSAMIERLTEEQEVLTEALVKGESNLQSQQEKSAILQKAVEELEEKLIEKEDKFNVLSLELQQLGQGYKEKEFVLRGIVQEANARNAQLERELKDLRSKPSALSLPQEVLDAKEEELKELKEKLAKQKMEAAEMAAIGDKLAVLEANHGDLKVLFAAKESEADALKKELDSLKERELLREDTFRTKEEEMATAGERLAGLESELESLKAHLAAKESEADALKDELESVKEQELLKAAEEMDALKEKLSVLVEEKESLQRERANALSALEEKELLVASLKDEVQRSKEREAAAEVVEEGSPKDWKKKLDAAIKEKDKFKDILAELKSLRKEDTKKAKEVQAQYKQLKQQFEEKAEALDDSRKALFHMQEKLLIVQREAEERPESDRSEVERLLEKQIGKMERERKQLLLEHQEEVTALQEIIDTLSSKQLEDALTN